jgi:hypothetical protein
MALAIKPDLAEYHLSVAQVTVTQIAETLVWVPIPQSGYITRIVAQATDIALNLATDITFELDGVLLKSDGATAAITLLAADVTGDSHVVEIDRPSAGGNLVALEAEHGDVITDGCVLEIIGDGETTADSVYSFIITVRQ